MRNLSDQVKFNWQLDIAMIPSKLFVTIRKLALVRGVVCIKIDISKMICLKMKPQSRSKDIAWLELHD